MTRRTFDLLASGAGLLLAVILLIAGGLLTWSHVFIDDQVHSQLAAQKIFFPPANSPAVSDPAFAAMHKYGGQQLTNGAQAETYANHFIAIHLQGVAGGKTYSEVSAAAQADPNNATLKAQADTLFKGNTLRGLLLNAYAFWKMGQIALIAAIVAFIGSALMFLLSFLGYRHGKRLDEVVQPAATTPVPLSV